MGDTTGDATQPGVWTDAEALIRAGWRRGPDLAARLGVSVRTLQRRAGAGKVRRVQVGRETFYATNDIGDVDVRHATAGGDGGSMRRDEGPVRVFSETIEGRVAAGQHLERRATRVAEVRHASVRATGDSGVEALLALVRELRESLVDAERRAAVAEAERDALRSTPQPVPVLATAQPLAPRGPAAHSAVGSASPASPSPASPPDDTVAAELHRLRGVVERRTHEVETHRQRVEALEHELARAGTAQADAARDRDRAQAEAVAARTERDGAVEAHRAVAAELDALRRRVAADAATALGEIVVAGEHIPMAEVEARMKRLVIERNEYRMQAKEFRDQRRRLEQDIKRMRRSRSAGRRIDDAGWSKR